MNTAITSNKIASALHQRLWPHLQALGFQYHIGRSYYRLLEGQVWQFSSRAVGHYFSLITDHPAHAFCAQMGIYPFEAAEQPYVERSLNERKPYWGYAGRDSQDLQALAISVQYREQTFRPEAERTDLWAVAPDGSNLEAVLADFEQAFLQQAPAWWQQVQSPEHIAQSLAHRAGTQYVWAKKARARIISKPCSGGGKRKPPGIWMTGATSTRWITTCIGRRTAASPGSHETGQCLRDPLAMSGFLMSDQWSVGDRRQAETFAPPICGAFGRCALMPQGC